MPTLSVSTSLHNLYDTQYDGQSNWRRICAVGKAADIATICNGNRFDTVLEVGAGEGAVLQRLDEIGFGRNLYGLEISASGVQIIQERRIGSLREARLFDGYTIPYSDKSFDLIYCTHVLEHVEHERLFLQELKRVARNVFIEVPLEDVFFVGRKIKKAREFGHINFYRRETLINLLRTVGLKPVRYQVVDFSADVLRFSDGWFKGSAKHAIRAALLRGAPRLAQFVFSYNIAVLAETID
jgi:SAM-dependent methyltransferase